MATKTYTVTGPDGKKYRVTAPETATREQILARVRAQAEAAAEQRATPSTLETTVRDVPREVIGGLTFEFGDEAEALGATAARHMGPYGGLMPSPMREAIGGGITGYQMGRGEPTTYGGEVERIRGEREEFRRRNPVTASALNIAGAAVPALLTMGASTGVSAPGMTAQMLRAGRVGAGQGALAGAGAAEGDLGNRAKGAAFGGLVGGVLGGLVPPAAASARRLVETGRNILFSPNQKQVLTRAQDTLLRALGRDRTTPAEVAERATAGARLGVDDLMMADIAGANTRQRMALAARSPSEGRAVIEEALQGRAGRAGAGLQSDVARAAGMPRQDTTALGETLVERMRANAAPLYERAYAVGPVDDPRIAAYMSRPQFQAGLREAVKLAQMEGRKLRVHVRRGPDGKEYPVFSVEALDDIKRGVDSLIDAQRDSVTGRLSPEGRVMAKSLNEFLEIIDDAVPEYKAARAQYAGDRALAEALTEGREALRMGADDWRDFAARFRTMTEGERRMAIAGLIDDIGLQLERRARVSGSTKAPDVTGLFTTQQASERLRALLPSQKAFDDFMKAVKLRERQAATRNKALAGSPTMELLSEAGDSAALNDIVTSISQGRVVPAVVGLARRAIDRGLGGVDEKVQNELARAMTLTGPELQVYLAGLDARSRMLVAQELERMGYRTGVSALTGSTTGRENVRGRYDE